MFISDNMAVRRVILSTASPSQNLASSLLDFANNDSLSTGEIYRTRKQTESTFKSLGLCWTGDFESLKYFVADSLKLSGTQSRSPSMPVRRLGVGIALEQCSGEIELIQACDWLTADSTLDFQREFYACLAIVAKYK